MKNFKNLAVGFVAGAVCMMSVPAIAATYKNVEAMLLPEAIFKFNDKMVASPSDMPVLNYQGYTYVPIRFVAEQLDCEVQWDVVSRQVRVKSPEPEVIERIVEKQVDKIVYVDKDSSEAQGNTVFYELPARIEKDGYTIRLKTVIMDDEDEDMQEARRTRVNISIENTDIDKVEVEQIETRLILDGKEFKMAKRDNLWDDRWDEEFAKEDEILEGYFVFDGIYPGYTTGTLQLPIKINDGNGFEREVVEINFKR